jgi:hypothetical protein
MPTLIGYACGLAYQLGYVLGKVEGQGETHYVLVRLESRSCIAYKSLDAVFNFLAVKQEMSS